MIEALVLQVIDGDSIRVHARIWPSHFVVTNVRIRGIDTPEIRGKCDEEKLQALRAKQFVEVLVNNRTIQLLQVDNDKYGDRVLAHVVMSDGRALGKALIEAGLARPYDGGEKTSWCP